MGLFSYLFGGGNYGLISKSIAQHHATYGNFMDVLDIYLNNFRTRDKSSKKFKKAIYAANLINKGKIKNYRDLAILALMVDAAPMDYDFLATESMVGDDVTKHLLKQGIERDLIYGDHFDDDCPF